MHTYTIICTLPVVKNVICSNNVADKQFLLTAVYIDLILRHNHMSSPCLQIITAKKHEFIFLVIDFIILNK